MNRIKDLRISAGWRQQDLAEKLNTVKSVISRYESGRLDLDTATICKLCDLFNCSADYLLGRSELMQPQASPEDQQLLHAYHSLPFAIRQAVDGLLAPYLSGSEGKKVV